MHIIIVVIITVVSNPKSIRAFPYSALPLLLRLLFAATGTFRFTSGSW